MRAIVLNGRIVKMLTLFVVIIPRLALSDANLGHSSRQADTSIRELGYELDPEDNGNSSHWAHSTSSSERTTTVRPM
jgi:hypothetical protein